MKCYIWDSLTCSCSSDDYEIHWHLNQLLPKFQNKENYQKTTEHQKRNRRFRYMQQHLLNTDFFSPENMRLRSPAVRSHL